MAIPLQPTSSSSVTTRELLRCRLAVIFSPPNSPSTLPALAGRLPLAAETLSVRRTASPTAAAIPLSCPPSIVPLRPPRLHRELPPLALQGSLPLRLLLASLKSRLLVFQASPLLPEPLVYLPMSLPLLLVSLLSRVPQFLVNLTSRPPRFQANLTSQLPQFLDSLRSHRQPAPACPQLSLQSFPLCQPPAFREAESLQAQVLVQATLHLPSLHPLLRELSLRRSQLRALRLSSKQVQLWPLSAWQLFISSEITASSSV